jgi:predicted Na+-dependent transporter
MLQNGAGGCSLADIVILRSMQPLVRLLSATFSALQLLRCAVLAAVLRSRRVRPGSRGALLRIAPHRC